MIKRFVILAAAAMPLAACDSGPSVSAENASAEEVAAKVADAGGTASFVSPGRWESKVTFEEMSMPGMTPEMAAQMKSIQGQVETDVSCLTPEEAAKPKEDFFGGDGDCTYERFTMAGGKIDAAMTCESGGSTQSTVMKGNYSANAFDVRMTAKGSGEDAGMSMTMSMEARRVGECDGSEEDA